MKPLYFHSKTGLGYPNAEPGKNIPKTKNYVVSGASTTMAKIKRYHIKYKQIWFINLKKCIFPFYAKPYLFKLLFSMKTFTPCLWINQISYDSWRFSWNLTWVACINFEKNILKNDIRHSTDLCHWNFIETTLFWLQK